MDVWLHGTVVGVWLHGTVVDVYASGTPARLYSYVRVDYILMIQVSKADVTKKSTGRKRPAQEEKGSGKRGAKNGRR